MPVSPIEAWGIPGAKYANPDYPASAPKKPRKYKVFSSEWFLTEVGALADMPYVYAAACMMRASYMDNGDVYGAVHSALDGDGIDQLPGLYFLSPRMTAWRFKLFNNAPDRGTCYCVCGTTTYDQWVSNILHTDQVTPTPWTTGKVHRGFNSAADGLLPQLDSDQHNVRSGKPWVMVGHSLGGAVAHLLFRKIFARSEGTNKCTSCYSFAAPRIGDTPYSDSWYPQTLRVVRDVDPVPLLPPTYYTTPRGNLGDTFTTFNHPQSDLIVMNRDGTFSWGSKTTGAGSGYLDAMAYAIKNIGSLGSLHSIKRYCQDLRIKLKRNQAEDKELWLNDLYRADEMMDSKGLD